MRTLLVQFADVEKIFKRSFLLYLKAGKTMSDLWQVFS